MAFFVAELLTYLLTTLLVNGYIRFAFSMLLIAGTFIWYAYNPTSDLPFQFMKGLQISGFMLIGITTKELLLHIVRIHVAIIAISSIFIMGACECFILLNYVSFPLEHATIAMFAAIVGAIGFICFSIIVSRSRLLSYIGRNSLVYYALNALTLNIVKLSVFRLGFPVLGLKASDIHLSFNC